MSCQQHATTCRRSWKQVRSWHLLAECGVVLATPSYKTPLYYVYVHGPCPFPIPSVLVAVSIPPTYVHAALLELRGARHNVAELSARLAAKEEQLTMHTAHAVGVQC